MARKNRFNNSQAKKGGKSTWGWIVSIILILIVLIGGYLAVSTYQEHKKRNTAPSHKTLSPERRRLPEKGKKMPSIQEPPPSAVIPYIPREKPKQTPPLRATGIIAIVIDDMGASLRELNALTSLQAPLTFSIIPQLPHAAEVAETAHDRGYEVMAHLPMEPKDSGQRRLERNGLLVSLSNEEITDRVCHYLELVPHAAGANNHMGSLFTEDSEKMLPVMRILKDRSLYFLDSRTTPLSVGYSLAQEVGVKSASRHVFLDNVREVEAIRLQLQKSAQIARKQGYAIAIGHPHQVTIEALFQSLPGLKAEGITFVKLSRVVK